MIKPRDLENHAVRSNELMDREPEVSPGAPVEDSPNVNPAPEDTETTDDDEPS